LRHTRDTLNQSDLFAVGEYWTSEYLYNHHVPLVSNEDFSANLLRRRMSNFEGEVSMHFGFWTRLKRDSSSPSLTFHFMTRSIRPPNLALHLTCEGCSVTA